MLYISINIILFIYYSFTIVDIENYDVYCNKCKVKGMVCDEYDDICICPLGSIGKHCEIGYNRYQIYVCY